MPSFGVRQASVPRKAQVNAVLGGLAVQHAGYDENSFSQDVCERWGNRCEHLVDEAGSIHSQVSWLAHLCETQEDLSAEILAFLEAVIGCPGAISEIQNAISISFLDWKALQSVQDGLTIAPNIYKLVEEQHERYSEAP